MALFDKIESTAQKAKDLAEAAKLKGIITTEEKNINIAFQQIGKTYYETHGENPEQPFAELTTKVKDSREKIAGYEEQINQLKGIVICHNCSGEVSDDMKFCGCCGSAVITAPVDVEPASNDSLCLKCGFVLAPDSLFCTSCGNNVEPLADLIPADKPDAE